MSAPVLSPAERDALEEYINRHGSGTHYMFINGVEAGWLACREWAEERERDLREVARQLRNAASSVALIEWATVPHCQPGHECATQLRVALCQRCRVQRLSAAIIAVSEALKEAEASPTPQEDEPFMGAGLMGPPLGPQLLAEPTPQEIP